MTVLEMIATITAVFGLLTTAHCHSNSSCCHILSHPLSQCITNITAMNSTLVMAPPITVATNYGHGLVHMVIALLVPMTLQLSTATTTATTIIMTVTTITISTTSSNNGESHNYSRNVGNNYRCV